MTQGESSKEEEDNVYHMSDYQKYPTPPRDDYPSAFTACCLFLVVFVFIPFMIVVFLFFISRFF